MIRSRRSPRPPCSGCGGSSFQALGRYLDGPKTPAELHRAVSADVHRAARLIGTGLNSSAFTAGTGGQ